MAMFSKMGVKRAEAVRNLQERLGFPSDTTLAKAIAYDVLGTFQFNRRDIRIANIIWGPSKGSLKGKSTARKGKMDSQDKVVEDIPPEVMNEYKDIHLDIDIMFVNGVAFLTAISRHLCMTHARAVLNRTHNRVKDAITAVKAAYEKRDFKVKTMHADIEFAPLNDWLTEKEVTLETCDTDQHVPQIERTNRFLKERIRCLRMDMPFKRIPRRFLIELVKREAIMINSLPLEGGVYDAMSARAIVTGKVLHISPCKLGEYVQAKVPTTNKTDKERTVDALYIGPNDNGTGH